MRDRQTRVQNVVFGLSCVVFIVSAGYALAVNPWIQRKWDAGVLNRDARTQWDSISHAAVGWRVDGSQTAPGVVMITDYECVYCRAAQATLDAWMAVGIRVGIIFAVRTGGRGQLAAASAVCGDRAGLFWPLHRYLMTESEWLAAEEADPLAGFLRIAELVGIASYERCLANGDYQRTLDQHRALVERLGNRGTPVFLTSHGGSVGLVPGEEPPEFAERLGLSIRQ